MRGEDKPLVIFPFLLSLALYISVLFGIFYYMKENEQIVKKYTSKKDNFLEIAIIKSEEKIIQVPKSANKKKDNKQDKVHERIAKKSHEGIKELFGKIKTKDLNNTKDISTPDKEASRASRLKAKELEKKADSKKAKKLASSLKLAFVSSLSSPSSTGEYDKFRGEVTEILEGFWYQTEGVQVGAEATVKVLIDKDGHFSYNIDNFSYNNDFNVKLRNFLEDMQNVKFPKNVDNVPPLTITFKDERI